MKVICAFSSDRRELYKADIYRALALPKGHILHFRYQKRYVDNNLLLGNRRLKNEKVAIFFTHGNEQEETERELTHISVRWATLVSHEISPDTDIFHAYLKLGDFCNLGIDSNNSKEKQPPANFFSELEYTESSESNNWQSRVERLKDFFPEIIFFYIKGIRDKKTDKKLTYSNDSRSCRFKLNHGKRYLLRLSLGNPKSINSKIELSDSSEEITINCINPLETSAPYDDFEIPIYVKTLQLRKQSSYLSFKPLAKEGKDFGEYATNIELDLNLNLLRPAIFGFFSTIAFWAVLLSKPLSLSASWPTMQILMFSSMFFVSSGGLFFWFNKK